MTNVSSIILRLKYAVSLTDASYCMICLNCVCVCVCRFKMCMSLCVHAELCFGFFWKQWQGLTAALMTSMIKGLLPLGLWYIIHSQNTSPAEHDVCFFPLKCTVYPIQTGTTRKRHVRQSFSVGSSDACFFGMLRSLNSRNITLKPLLFFPE